MYMLSPSDSYGPPAQSRPSRQVSSAREALNTTSSAQIQSAPPYVPSSIRLPTTRLPSHPEPRVLRIPDVYAATRRVRLACRNTPPLAGTRCVVSSSIFMSTAPPRPEPRYHLHIQVAMDASTCQVELHANLEQTLTEPSPTRQTSRARVWEPKPDHSARRNPMRRVVFGHHPASVSRLDTPVEPGTTTHDPARRIAIRRVFFASQPCVPRTSAFRGTEHNPLNRSAAARSHSSLT
ncbi:uncharacterized protein B0H18DRAFT_1122312 [Fomitopsis serialis]|uniref:uncharacterized protein n=1 Tax=Fomitopsis serialis TaxID=139415 RepID=UPI00200894B3|nr:uncharacterized protein B0H18DRAFT_1122312 [Neoantrodia serialis]KAH9919873.1 hypothetical protein B0H18DRAFT_1122312 [Neoantrodia serialis]